MRAPEPPLDPPRWRVLLANLIVIGILGALVAGHHYLTWRFSLGVVAATLLCTLAIRARYGFWPFNDD